MVRQGEACVARSRAVEARDEEEDDEEDEPDDEVEDIDFRNEVANFRTSPPRTPSWSSSGPVAGQGPRSPSSSSGDAGHVRLPAITLRSGSVGAIGQSGVTRAYLQLTVSSRVDDAEVAVELAEGELERGSAGLPERLSKGQVATVELRSSTAIAGVLRIGGAPPVPFGIQVRPSGAARAGAVSLIGPERVNFVAAENRQRTVVAHASGELELGSGVDAKGDGIVAEVAVGPGHRAEMTITVRKAKKKELARLAQTHALLSAMDQKKYSTLIAQIARAKMRKVETSLIDRAGRLLKSIRMPENHFLSHKELANLMKWKRVTTPAGATCDDIVPCGVAADCPCNADKASHSEICTVTSDLLSQALEGVAPADEPADKWLFKALVKAAIQAPEGCVWKSGGKFLLTNEERNQSPNAIVSVLEREGPDSDASKGIRSLVAFTERDYGFRVTAIQLNFHPNNKSSHKQHRDIYGAGQKGGINCTCSFMKCTGTVCFSLGSSRQVLVETIADSRSKYEACCEECAGCKTFKWMHSGSAMYFNAPFNNNHTHGVPPQDDPCGPRISIALLCA